jgi:hypothetical protein
MSNTISLFVDQNFHQSLRLKWANRRLKKMKLSSCAFLSDWSPFATISVGLAMFTSTQSRTAYGSPQCRTVLTSIVNFCLAADWCYLSLAFLSAIMTKSAWHYPGKEVHCELALPIRALVEFWLPQFLICFLSWGSKLCVLWSELSGLLNFCPF